MTKWFVVADKFRSQPDDPDDCVWTLSRNPDEIGWETDSGCPSYGLLKKDAEELAGAANRIEKLEATLRNVAVTLDSEEIPYMVRNRYACATAKEALEAL